MRPPLSWTASPSSAPVPAADGPDLSGDDRPIGDDEGFRLLRHLAPLGRLGIAVSGGPDSTALLLLLSRERNRRPDLHLLVLTVDHGLRPEARAEAEAVVRLARQLGLDGRILTWTHEAGGPPSGDLQALAREARYRLLAEAARDAGLEAVALAHTLDDVAETFLMRLSRGSGVWGLAAMRAWRTFHGIRFVRPLIDVPKARLVATCRTAGLSPVDDPSNRADRFLRVRARAALPKLAPLGIDSRNLAATARRLARAVDALDHAVAALARTAAVDHGGVVSIDPAALLAAPDEIALRLLAGRLSAVRPSPYPPRAASLESWWETWRREGHAPRRTLGGAVLDLRPGRLWVYAEAGRRGFPEIEAIRRGRLIWDGRFVVDLAADLPRPVLVRAARGPERRADLPKAAAASLPVIVSDDPLGASLSVTLRPLFDESEGPSP